MKKPGFSLFVLVLISSSLSGLTVKLGSPFPEGTPWDTTLKRMALSGEKSPTAR